MKKSRALLVMIGGLWASVAGAWEANVTGFVHHWDYVAVYLSPDPGPGNCSHGQPYLIPVNETIASKQRIAMIMQALATGQKVTGWHGDPCDSAIWGQSRPRIERLMISAN